MDEDKTNGETPLIDRVLVGLAEFIQVANDEEISHLLDEIERLIETK